jgi:hypothetical protein
MARPRSISHVGEKYNKLTILEQHSEKKAVYFTVQCECGTIKKIRKDSIIGPRAETKSCGCLLKAHDWNRGQDPRSPLWSRAKYRAKQKGREFTITKEDIVIPDICPLLGTPMKSPSLDRIDSSKGYVKGNVWVISNRANTLKNDATLTELKTLVENLENIC